MMFSSFFTQFNSPLNASLICRNGAAHNTNCSIRDLSRLAKDFCSYLPSFLVITKCFVLFLLRRFELPISGFILITA